jgi:glycosyltransferase involved in cell wall biosynthesis
MVSVSGWVDARLHQSPICAGLHSCVIGNGIDTVNVFRPVQSNELKIKLGISDEKILLHVTAGFSDGTDDLKGGRHIIALANLLINQNIKIIVVGFNDLDPNFILPSNVTVMGEITNQVELAKYYSLADLTVIASKRETFGMVCAESLCCGTPVVGFKSGGPETISLKKFSEFVDNGNVELLKSCVEKWITKKDTFEENIAEIAAEHYSKEKMAEEYYQLYEKFLNE